MPKLVSELDSDTLSPKYWAFLSYSHRDEEWAKWLHKELETYRIPRRLVGRPGIQGRIPERAFPVFRDCEELASSPSLSNSIEQALVESRFLIVICSPNAAASWWVNEEIRFFKLLGREARIFCLIVAGEPFVATSVTDGSGSLPPALLQSENTLETEPANPLAADARPEGTGKTDAVLRLVAGMVGISFDELKQRDRRRRSKRRFWASLAILAASGGLALFYLGLVDAAPDLPLPGNKAIISILDSNELSFFRRPRTNEQIRGKALEMRQRLLARLMRSASSNGHILKNSNNDFDTWTTAQSLCAIAKAPEASSETLGELRRQFEAVFTPKEAAQAASQLKLGKAEPVLWTATALAVTLQRRDQLQPELVREYWGQLQHTQEFLGNYHPHRATGGWSMFACETDCKGTDFYTSVLALEALLETREAALPWEASAQRRDELILRTATHLTNSFLDAEELSGWHVFHTVDGGPPEGLTLQILAVLLRTESVQGFTLPSKILRFIPQYLSQFSNRDLRYPNQSAEIFYEHGSETIEFLWYPWAIQTAWLWLERPASSVDSHLDTIRVRQVLGHLVVDLGNQAVEEAERQDAFRAADTLYALSRIPPPQGLDR